ANDGRRAAGARGARFRRKPKLDEHQRKEALQRLLAGESARGRDRGLRKMQGTFLRLATLGEPRRRRQLRASPPQPKPTTRSRSSRVSTSALRPRSCRKCCSAVHGQKV